MTVCGVAGTVTIFPGAEPEPVPLKLDPFVPYSTLPAEEIAAYAAWVPGAPTPQPVTLTDSSEVLDYLRGGA